MTTTPPDRHVIARHSAHVAVNRIRALELRTFRQHVESQGRLPLAEISLEAAFLLFDLCQHFRLDPDQVKTVLGDQTYTAIQNHLGSAGK